MTKAFIKVNPDSTKLMTINQKCAERVINLQDFTDEQIKPITAPVLIINGEQGVATSEHILAMSKLIPNCKLAIVTGGHGAYIGEIATLNHDYKTSYFNIPIIERFLDEKQNDN
ncbi:MAG: hypothetical protein IT240_00625 [Bacteroidia bacterium]|nr:hypothetical protein [Bacteroidia bacterium]